MYLYYIHTTIENMVVGLLNCRILDTCVSSICMYIYMHHLLECFSTEGYSLTNHTYLFRSNNKSMVTLKNCNILFQPHPEPEDDTMPPPPKRLRSDEMTRVIIILPHGGRQHLDMSKESTLKVGSANTMKNCSFK